MFCKFITLFFLDTISMITLFRPNAKPTFKLTQKYIPLLNMGYICTEPTIKSFKNEEKKQPNEKCTAHTNTNVIESLELEKAQHEWKVTMRMKLFKEILINKSVILFSPKFCFSILVTILVCSGSTNMCTLIQFHNLLLYPTFRYELLFLITLSCIWIGIFCSYIFGHYLNTDDIKETSYMLVLTFAMTVVSFFVTVAMQLHYITNSLFLEYPTFYSFLHFL